MRRNQALFEFCIVFSFFLLSALYLYWGARIDYPRGDHPGYMAERLFFDSPSDWFWHSVSFSRTRLVHPGDYFCFRPGFQSILYIQDILFRGNLLPTGISSIILFGGVSTALYYSCRLFAGIVFSFIVALIFMTLPINQEMVCWRHISPYMFSLLFSAIAFIVMNKTVKVFHFRWIWFFAFLFFSTLFHEIMAVSIALSLLLVYIINRQHHRNSRASNVVTPFFLWSAIAFAVYLFFNLLDWWVHTPPSFLGLGDSELSPGRIMNLPFYLYSTFSATVRAAFLPFTIDFHWVRRDLLHWDFARGGTYINALAFLIGAAILFLSAFRLRSRREVSNFSNADFLLVFSISVIISTIFSLVLVRAAVRTIGYLHRATYYWTITSFCWLYIVAYNLWPVLVRIENFPNIVTYYWTKIFFCWSYLLPPNSWPILVRIKNFPILVRIKILPKRRAALIGLLAICLFVVGSQTLNLKSNVSRFYDLEKANRYQHHLKNISAFFSSHESFCLSLFNLETEIPDMVPPQHLSGFKCNERIHLVPQNRLILDIDGDGDLLLFKIDGLQDSSAGGIPLSMNFLANDRFRRRGDEIVSVNPSSGLYEGAGFLLSENLYTYPEMSVELTNPTYAGLVINYLGPDDFELFVIDGLLNRNFGNYLEVYAHVMENGQLSLLSKRSVGYAAEKVYLNIKNSRKRTYLLIDGRPLTSLPKRTGGRGKCGIFFQRNGFRNQIFSIPIVVDNDKVVFKPFFNVSSGRFIN